MNMTLSGKTWKVENFDDTICISSLPSEWGIKFTPADARELAVALDKVIEHVEGESDAMR